MTYIMCGSTQIPCIIFASLIHGQNLLQILETPSIPLHGLHRIFHQFRHDVKCAVNLHVGHLPCYSATVAAVYCEAT